MNLNPMIVNSTLLSIIIFLLGFIGAYLKKTLEKMIAEVELSHKRHEVTDIVISSLLKDSFNSRGIAEDKMEWPEIFSHRRPRES